MMCAHSACMHKWCKVVENDSCASMNDQESFSRMHVRLKNHSWDASTRIRIANMKNAWSKLHFTQALLNSLSMNDHSWMMGFQIFKWMTIAWRVDLNFLNEHRNSTIRKQLFMNDYYSWFISQHYAQLGTRPFGSCVLDRNFLHA